MAGLTCDLDAKLLSAVITDLTLSLVQTSKKNKEGSQLILAFYSVLCSSAQTYCSTKIYLVKMGSVEDFA